MAGTTTTVSTAVTSVVAADTAIDYARKTYRYLRIAVVSMVLSVIVSLIIEGLGAGAWHRSVSAYYYTAVNPLFVAAMIMIGICLIAIRGTTDFEDIVLNLTGIMAPVVALVPTALPEHDHGGSRFEPDVEKLINNTVPALLIAAAIASALTFWLASKFSGQNIGRAAVPPNTWIGLVLAVLIIVVLLGVYLAWGRQWAHNAAAIALFAGLWIVATENVVRHATDGTGRHSPDAALQAGVGGSLLLLALTLAGLGVWNLLLHDNGAAVSLLIAAAGAVGVVLFSPRLTVGAAGFFTVIRSRHWYRRFYFMVAAWMLAVGVGVRLAPAEWDHRTFYLELLELIPFALFWLVQTIEHWNEPVEPFDYRAAPHYLDPSDRTRITR